MRAAPTEGWIVAGTIAGQPAFPNLREDVCGMPYVLRLAADLAHAGARTIYVVWRGDGPVPGVDDFSNDPRLKGAKLAVVTSLPMGDGDDAVLVMRADRIFHRDLSKFAVRAWRDSSAPLAKAEGADLDAVCVTTRARASLLVDDPVFVGETATVPPPYLAFCTRAHDHISLRRAERTLVWSLRKAADGIASKAINRHISLPVTWRLMRTQVHPNAVTVFCVCLAILGGYTISRGGYWAGAIGMLIFNLGSILDGVDGELARLKYWQSQTGQWLDTVADDLGNVAYITGIAMNLDAAGVTWAKPLAMIALGSFVLTQSTQYALIALVYKSGDLAAIPWAFQSADFLGAEKPGFWGTLPKLLKRDFALTMFVGFAFIGWLQGILFVFSAGAIVFLGVFAVQFARNVHTLRRPR